MNFHALAVIHRSFHPSGEATPVETFWEYMNFYQRTLNDRWHHLRPHEYTIILSVVAAIGWWLMQFKKRA